MHPGSTIQPSEQLSEEQSMGTSPPPEGHAEGTIEPGTLYSRDEVACLPLTVAASAAQPWYSVTDNCRCGFEYGSADRSGLEAANASADKDNITDDLDDQYLDSSSALILSNGPSSIRESCLMHLPNEVLLHVLDFLDVSDLLATSRVHTKLSGLGSVHQLTHLQ